MSSENTPQHIRESRSILIRWVVVLVLAAILAFWATWRMSKAAGSLPSGAQATTGKTAAAEPKVEYWTCTMDPQVEEDQPGKCPICGMKLVPKYVGSDVPDVKPTMQSSSDSGAHAHQQHGMSSNASDEKRVETEAWYRCTMPECGDVGSADPDSRCPVCGMKRERVDMNAGDSEYEITLNERARRLAEVEAEPVRQQRLYRHIRTVGRVGYDETRYKMVSAWIGGRIDKLFADYTGMTVNEGDHLVEIYSPQLLSAQEEYLQALRASGGSQNSQSTIAQQSREQLLRSARRKLELLGITDSQIADIEESKTPQTHLVVYAPLGGTIIKKQAMEGKYVDTGDALYTIADLTHVWLLVDLYESDLAWVHPFQDVRVTTRSLPGEVFTGQIMFINPTVDPETRTVPVRIHVDNPEMRLKPDMWVTAQIHARLGKGGLGAVPAPDGDYACPMHPWETADRVAACPVCQMDMVPVEKLPKYQPPTDQVPMLAVPRGAVMQTGERAIVYIERKPGTYLGKEVQIGPLAQNQAGRQFYPVLSGLTGGELVVTRGNFAIDSQMQLAGKPSLFSARGFSDPHEGMHDADADAPAPEQDHTADHADHATTTSPADHAHKTIDVVQKVCPVMGNEIDKEVYTDLHGVRVYFCCPPCIEKFRNNPEEYMANLPEAIQDQLKAAMREADSQKTETQAADDRSMPVQAEDILQTTCPVMGNEIDKEVYTDLHGVRVYFCCPPCIEKFRNNPEEYMANLPEAIQNQLKAAMQEVGHD